MKTRNNNINWSYCKYSFLCKQWYLAGLKLGENHFQTRKQNYIWHKWSLVTFKIHRVPCSRNEKTLSLRKAAGSTGHHEQREGQSENKILFNNLWVFNISKTQLTIFRPKRKPLDSNMKIKLKGKKWYPTNSHSVHQGINPPLKNTTLSLLPSPL